MKKRILWFCAVNAGLLVLSLLFLFGARLAEAWGTPTGCVFLRATGLYCPACGGTRALSALLRGRLWSSFLFYPPLWAAIGWVAVWDAKALLSFITGDEKFLASIRPQRLWWLLGIVGVWFVLRNVLWLAWGVDFLGDLSAAVRHLPIFTVL